MFDVVIIGAGPAGLSLAHWLQKRNVSTLILESGRAGESWRGMPADTYLLSPWWTNCLPGTRLDWQKAWNKISSQQFADYLADYANSGTLNVRERCRVLRLTKNKASELEIETTQGTVSGKIAVCATGYYQNPFFPVLSGGNDSSLPTLHASEYVNPSALLERSGGGRRVLIVGKRITAGQMMHELHDQGFEVSLSSRSRVETRPAWRMNVWKERFYFLYESVFVKVFPNIKAKSRPVMDGGRKADLLRIGAVRWVGPVQGIREGEVQMQDGTSHPCDVVIFATGYRPALQYLAPLVSVNPATGLPELSGMASATTPSVYFLGLENLRNFLSPYLRGIRSDAKILARILHQRLRSD